MVVNNVNAYRLNGYKFSNPKDVKFKVSSFVSTYTDDVINYTMQWEYYTNEIKFKRVSSGENIYFFGEYSIDNGTYAVCTHNSSSHKSIVFYKSFNSASNLQRRETIVHEVGHALGLSHCESSKNNISVMRERDFNNKPYPLSDDIDGIKAIY